MIIRLILLIASVALILGCNSDSRKQDEAAQSVNAQVLADSSLSMLNQGYEHSREGNYVQALVCAEQAIKLNPTAYDPRDLKYDMLRRLERPQEALEVALFNETLNIRKSPWDPLKQAEAYIEMGRFEEAIDRIAEAVENRDFRKYRVLQSPVYAPLQEDERFIALLEKSIINGGIDLPAKDFELIMLDGSSLKLSDMKGKIVLVDFWATWCSPCIREMPNLKKIYTAHQSEGFEIIGISVDENLDAMRAYVENENLNWLIGYSGTGPGWEDEILKRYKVNALPSTWLIDREGIVRYQGLRGEELGQAVTTLLNG
jgi:peroxiredoxin